MLFCHIVVPGLMLWKRRVRSSPIALFLITLVTGVLRHNHAPFNWGTMRLRRSASLS
jgi:hypothetical protein